MADFDFMKQAQEYYALGPAIILGSGASAAYGLSGMWDLADHLMKSIAKAEIDEDQQENWGKFCGQLEGGIDLETALHNVPLSESLTRLVVLATWQLINPQDIDVFKQSLGSSAFFHLGRLLSAMFRSAKNEIDIITTNYDRLAEYACDQEGIHHYTGFTHGYLRTLVDKEHLHSRRQVNIWKVHGSLDWMKSPVGEIRAFGQTEYIPDGYAPQIVTPGINKYEMTYHEPFRSAITHADEAFLNASSYLCIGFGFNDQHIQEKLVERCVRHGCSITVVTRSMSESAKKFLFDSGVENYLCATKGDTDGQSVLYSSKSTGPIVVENDYWTVNGYMEMVL